MLSYFDRVNSGDMMSRVVNDLFDICEAAHHVPEWIIICGVEIIGAFVILFTISPALTGIMALVAARIIALMVVQNLRMRSSTPTIASRSPRSTHSFKTLSPACAW